MVIKKFYAFLYTFIPIVILVFGPSPSPLIANRETDMLLFKEKHELGAEEVKFVDITELQICIVTASAYTME